MKDGSVWLQKNGGADPNCSAEDGNRENGRFASALVEYCAPTLAGVKPANLFLYRFAQERREFGRAVAFWAGELAPYGLRLRILREHGQQACLVYLYREAWLSRILSERLAASFLERFGYRRGESAQVQLNRLAGRVRLEREFPHEIGVFLGYPLFDVISFMENRGRNFAFCGCWKAYDDPVGARRRSEQFRKCSRIYRRMFACGTPVQRLVVAA